MEKELVELKVALREGGVLLTERARLRKLWGGTINTPPNIFSGAERQTQNSLVPTRKLQEETKAADQSGVNAETIAIVLTGVLGIAGCVRHDYHDYAYEYIQFLHGIMVPYR